MARGGAELYTPCQLCYTMPAMADGKEDLQEKNKDSSGAQDAARSLSPRYAAWTRFQGHEDAEMLQEKSAGWSSTRDNRGDYDDRDE